MEHNNKWNFLQPEKREMSKKDQIVMAISTLIFVASIIYYKNTGNETLSLCGLAIVALLFSINAFYESTQLHVKRASRRYLQIAIASLGLFIFLAIVITKRLLNI